MFPTLLALTLMTFCGLAEAGEHDTTDAAALLSRFDAGHVPPVEPVLDALVTLAVEGKPEHLPLLESLTRLEPEPVNMMAAHALRSVLDRHGPVVAEAVVEPPPAAQAPSRGVTGTPIAATSD
jgi:hypothetical protein